MSDDLRYNLLNRDKNTHISNSWELESWDGRSAQSRNDWDVIVYMLWLIPLQTTTKQNETMYSRNPRNPCFW